MLAWWFYALKHPLTFPLTALAITLVAQVVMLTVFLTLAAGCWLARLV